MTPIEAKRLWTLLAQTYGHKFLDQYGPSPNEAWSGALSRMKASQATFAFRKLVDAGSAFPPTLPEFVQLAKGAPVLEEPVPRLGHVTTRMTPEQIESRRREMFEALGKRIPA